MKTRSQKNRKFIKTNRTSDTKNSVKKNLFLLRKADLCNRLNGQFRKPKMSWMNDIENFSYKFLTLQGIIAPFFIAFAFAFVNPLIGIIGIGLSVLFSIPYGLYFAITEAKKRKLEDIYWSNKMNIYRQKDTLLDYLDSDEFKNIVANLNNLSKTELFALNDKLCDRDILKDIIKSQDLDELQKAIIAIYIKTNKMQATMNNTGFNSFHTRKTKYVYHALGFASTGVSYAALLTGLCFYILAISGIAVSPIFTGGISLVAIIAGLAIAGLVAVADGYAHWERDCWVRNREEISKKLEEQYVAIKYLQGEVNFINREIKSLHKDENDRLNDTAFFSEIFTPIKNTHDIPKQRRSNTPGINPIKSEPFYHNDALGFESFINNK